MAEVGGVGGPRRRIRQHTVLMGAQRPGLNGIKDPDQVISYVRLFVNCRRLEALLCWERFGEDLANVVYAAWVAGVRAADLALR
jgi:hypothetical protein